MKKSTRYLLVLLALLLTTAMLLAASPAMLPAASPAIDWWALGGGGGRLTQGDLVLEAVAGQSVVEHSSQERLALCSGFLCQQAGFSVYLPLVHTNLP